MPVGLFFSLKMALPDREILVMMSSPDQAGADVQLNLKYQLTEEDLAGFMESAFEIVPATREILPEPAAQWDDLEDLMDSWASANQLQQIERRALENH